MNSVNKGRKSGGAGNLYGIHDCLTDRKILGDITPEEERRLQEVRSGIEARGQGLIDFYQNKITVYRGLLEEIKKIKAEINPK